MFVDELLRLTCRNQYLITKAFWESVVADRKYQEALFMKTEKEMAKYDDTKFYWLQLREDFFDEGAIDWLEEQPNGKEYSLFYLKLCLKSLRTNGILERHVGSIIVPYDYKKLAEITKTNPDTVLIALDLLIKLGLIEKLDTGALYMKEVANMIGSQSIGAFKKQQQRELARNKKLLLGEGVDGAGTNVHQDVHENIEIEKELELEQDIDIEDNVDIDGNATTTTKKKHSTRFVKPTVEQIAQYCIERNNNINPQYFWDYYESKGWMVGRSGMKDWKCAIRTWEQNNYYSGKPKQQSVDGQNVGKNGILLDGRKTDILDDIL